MLQKEKRKEKKGNTHSISAVVPVSTEHSVYDLTANATAAMAISLNLSSSILPCKRCCCWVCVFFNVFLFVCFFVFLFCFWGGVCLFVLFCLLFYFFI